MINIKQHIIYHTFNHLNLGVIFHFNKLCEITIHSNFKASNLWRYKIALMRSVISENFELHFLKNDFCGTSWGESISQLMQSNTLQNLIKKHCHVYQCCCSSVKMRIK